MRKWLERNPRVHLHFIPTGAAWLNMVERLFCELTEKQSRRLAVNSVGELIDTVLSHLDRRNDDGPKPYVWTMTAKVIITKIDRGLRTLAIVH